MFNQLLTKLPAFLLSTFVLLMLPTSDAVLYAQPKSYFSPFSFFHRDASIWNKVNENYNFRSFTHENDVSKQIKWFLHHPSEIHDLTYHSRQYIYYILQEVKKRDMPPEIALLPMIESDFNPLGSSNRSASGLWQLRPATARGLGVHINDWYDGRKDVVASTNAALNYLQYLHHYFNNWLLALAAYNSGIGTVTHALNYNRAHRRPMDFWSLPLPRQTKAYVPKLIAISTILSNPKAYNLSVYPVSNQPYFQAVKLQSPVSLNHIAKITNADMKTIRKLNAGIRSVEVKPHHTYNFLIPVSEMDKFRYNLAHHVTTKSIVVAHNTPHIVKKKQTLHHHRTHHHTRLATRRTHHRHLA